MSVDELVMRFGIWADNRLQERFEDGTPKYTVEDILFENDESYQRRKNQQTIEALMKIGAGAQ